LTFELLAAGELEAAAADGLDPPAAGELEPTAAAAGALDDELDEHPAISAATTAITALPAAMRLRFRLMVHPAPLRRAFAPKYIAGLVSGSPTRSQFRAS
jgi:hypothetical protein